MRIHPWFAGFPFVLKLWEIFILLIKFNGEIWRRIGDIWRKYFANLAPSKIPPPTPSTYSLLSIVLVGENLPWHLFGFVMLILIILIIYTAEMQKVIRIAEINFWPKKISTKKWPRNDPKWLKIALKWPKIAKMAQKWPKMAQKLAPAEKNSTDLSATSAAFCISAFRC